MNEFIVWDDIEKDFVTNIDLDDFELYSKGCSVNFILGFSAHLQSFNYIGKTDDTPEKNKIYADCSIVEFDKVETDKYFKEISRVKYTGHFFFDVPWLGYRIKAIGENGWNLSTNWGRGLENLKVIGTLQEKPELIKEKIC